MGRSQRVGTGASLATGTRRAAAAARAPRGFDAEPGEEREARSVGEGRWAGLRGVPRNSRHRSGIKHH